jgi:glutathione peroxidase
MQTISTLATKRSMQSLYDFEVTTIDGHKQCFGAYRDRVLLIVNVASRCGFTPQYAGLDAMHRKYRDQGFTVLGFPCDQFGHQEPGNETEIKSFCESSYGITFPLFAKIAVNGPNAHPLYRYLKSARRGFLGTKAIKWNFTKFLVDRHGKVVRRYAPVVAPDRIDKDLSKICHEQQLNAN